MPLFVRQQFQESDRGRHDIRLMDENLAYVAETDVPNRSGYLWECELEV